MCGVAVRDSLQAETTLAEGPSQSVIYEKYHVTDRDLGRIILSRMKYGYPIQHRFLVYDDGIVLVYLHLAQSARSW